MNSGIARITQTPPHPPIRATLPTLSAVATIDESFSLSKKRAQKNSGKGKPPPPIRAMPELKRFFCFAVVPKSTFPFNFKDSKKSNILFFQAQIFGEPGRKDSLGRNSDGVHLRGPAGSEVFTRAYGNLIKDVIYNI